MQTLTADVQRAVNGLVGGLWVRGLVAIAFGLVVLVDPQISLSVLVFLVAAFAAVDGITSLAMAFLPMTTGSRVLLIVSGFAGLAVAAITVINPQISELALLLVIGTWAIVIGVIQLMLAVNMPIDTGSRIALVVYGLAAIAFGTVMFVRPGTGALGLVALISAYAIVTGVTLLVAGWKLRSSVNEVTSATTSSVASGNA